MPDRVLLEGRQVGGAAVYDIEVRCPSRDFGDDADPLSLSRLGLQEDRVTICTRESAPSDLQCFFVNAWERMLIVVPDSCRKSVAIFVDDCSSRSEILDAELFIF